MPCNLTIRCSIGNNGGRVVRCSDDTIGSGRLYNDREGDVLTRWVMDQLGLTSPNAFWDDVNQRTETLFRITVDDLKEGPLTLVWSHEKFGYTCNYRRFEFWVKPGLSYGKWTFLIRHPSLSWFMAPTALYGDGSHPYTQEFNSPDLALAAGVEGLRTVMGLPLPPEPTLSVWEYLDDS